MEKKNSQLDKARKTKIRRIVMNNIDKLVELAGYGEISSIGPFETFGQDDRMETIWIYHTDGIATIAAYMCDEVENDVNALNSFLYALAMIRFMMTSGGRPCRVVIIGLEISDDLIQEFGEINWPFALLSVRGNQATFYPSRIDNISELPGYVKIHEENC